MVTFAPDATVALSRIFADLTAQLIYESSGRTIHVLLVET